MYSEIPTSSIVATTLRTGLRHLKTAWLFTKSDFKTVILPVMVFTNIVSPRHSPLALSRSLSWLWLHLFQCNVSNQSYTTHEDLLNKPWRPLPSGRISVENSRALRWGLMVFCLGFSSFFSFNVLVTSVVFTILVIVHDDFGLSRHPICKNLLNVGAYVSFELGSTLVMSDEPSLDKTSMTALLCSALVILVTIHVQDFQDVDGDRMIGRRTLPIVAPEGSRIYVLCMLPLVSFALASFWSLGPLCSVLFILMGIVVGIRCFLVRDEIGDRSNYWMYNIWLMGAHLLPANARFCVLAW
ncbi:UbiA prenyltransferase family-domain-containing protein [Suillus clintonianus]|uniref:UbiA prenyltransferase family-domain-containing protein n=1 Tax=Suillus clintonianus TaxID=1904413 RepID=UPI001B85DFBD|nr:UbiA prenyltransferase family-domain-containing protein [Suillus clintonianus]KAG2130892.1 UbiA prenyltransferase family-domain-containing protein [Suillus clintonianus]